MKYEGFSKPDARFLILGWRFLSRFLFWSWEPRTICLMDFSYSCAVRFYLRSAFYLTHHFILSAQELFCLRVLFSCYPPPTQALQFYSPRDHYSITQRFAIIGFTITLSLRLGKLTSHYITAHLTLQDSTDSSHHFTLGIIILKITTTHLMLLQNY